MKRITLFVLFLSTIWGYSQVKNYTFSQSTGNYTEIVGGTELGSTTSDGQKFLDPASPQGGTDNIGPGFPIGFDFTFNGFTYDRFGVLTDGYIVLGSSGLTPSVNTNVSSLSVPISSTKVVDPEVLANRIAPLAKDLQGQTDSSLRFQTSGVAPNRVLVVQWKNYRKYNAVGDSFNFQVILHETSNKVEFVYGKFTSTPVANATYQVGLRAEPSAVATNYVSRTSDTGWNLTTASTASTGSVLMNETLKPSEGLTFTWTPPGCGYPKNVQASALTTNSATVTWDYYTPAPTGYEYVVTTSNDAPTGKGTDNKTGIINLIDLAANTNYNVFIRSYCGTEYTAWSLEGSFRTKCLPSTTFYENFDIYNVATTTMPYCWEKGGNGTCNMTAGASLPGSVPNRLTMTGSGSGTPTTAYAIMPQVSTLQTDNYRLKFKAYATSTAKTLDVGYYTDKNNPTTFVLIEAVNLPGTTADKAQEFLILPKSIPAGVECLGFRNMGTATASTTVYIDDVVYEPIPPCTDVSAIVVNNTLSTSAKLKWNANGTETAWQYAYAPATVMDPSGLTIYDTDKKEGNMTGLTPATSHKAWVRSKCGDNTYGAWIGPLVFDTTCPPVNELYENFDVSTSLPSCWLKVGTGFVGTSTITPASAPRSLYFYNTTAVPMSVVMAPLGSIADHRLRFKIRGNASGKVLEVGYMTDINDVSTFTLMQSYTATSSTVYDEIITTFGSTPTTPYIAFRVVGINSSNMIYLDDVVWEPIPTCPDITALALNTTASDLIEASWTTSGTESDWQYAVGTPETVNPYTLTAKDFTIAPMAIGTSVSGTITGLTPSTSYKVWLRSKCSPTQNGAWIGPMVFSTTCAPVTAFTENFDSSLLLPSCFAKIGTTGIVSVAATTTPSSPNAMTVYAGSATSKAVVALTPVSNASDATHVLRFKFKGSVAGAVIEVGYIKNISDPLSFAKVGTYTAENAVDFMPIAVEFGSEPTSQVLAFRNPGVPSSTIYIDDVIWEKLPACNDITDPAIEEVLSDNVKVSWTKGTSETKWQYALGSATDTDPTTLTATDFVSPVINGTTVNGNIGNMLAETSYKIWIRSVCGSNGAGVWIGPLSFTTTCAPTTAFTQNFDAGTAFPACWSKVGPGNASISIVASTSAPNSLSISSSTSSKGIVAMQPASNADAGTHRLRFKLRGSVLNAVVEVGYLKNILDPNSFESYEAIIAGSTTGFDTKSSKVVTPTGKQTLALRNPGNPSSTVYIDDVVWEPIPTCPDINKPIVADITGFTAQVNWVTAGTATAWQYAIGSVTDTDPNTLTAVNTDTAVVTINQLQPVKDYKVWVRAKCGDTDFGLWSDPTIFSTACLPITAHTQNFDLSTNIPNCWKKVGTGTVTVTTQTGMPSAPYVLGMYTTTTINSIVAMPELSNVSSGTHRLKFKFRSSVTSGIMEVGYVTDLNNPDSFVALQSYTSTSTTVFQAKTLVPGTTPTAGSFLAFKTATKAAYSYIDDVIWEPLPPCGDLENFIVSTPTTTTVKLSWQATGSETAWQYAATAPSVTDPANIPAAAIVDTDVTNPTAGGLTPNGTYKFWARSKCSGGVFGEWVVSEEITMPCNAVATISENFDNGLSLPDCWHKVKTNGNVTVAATKGTSGTNALELTSQAASSAVFATIPAISTATVGGYRLKFKYKASLSATKIEIICYKDPINLNNLTGGFNFTVLKQINVAAANTDYSFDGYLPAAENQHLGFRVYQGSGVTTVHIDDFAWELPSEPVTCATGITATPDANCGNFANVISWTAVANAGGYKLTIGKTAGGKDILDNKDMADVLTYTFKGEANTTYYYTVKPYNGLGDATNCPEMQFSTAAENCYCPAVPTSNDGSGITNVQIGATNFANGDVMYKNFSTNPVNVTKGTNTNLKITLNTGSYAYNNYVWVDFNNDYDFDATELVYTGKSVVPNPNVVDASFMLPATISLGNHGMRVVSTYSAQTPANPCYGGSYGIVLDFKINVVAPAAAANDEPANAIALTTGGTFDTNAITGTNVDSTGSLAEPAANCGNYNGMDVWYKAVVPASGKITFEVKAVTGGLTKMGAAVYSGTVGNFTLVTCDGTSGGLGKGVTAGDEPKISLTDRTPGEVLYLRVWENGGDSLGAYLVSAYDASVLSSELFDNANFSFHPNPVKEMLNLSYSEQIDNVSIVNLLGQEVISKAINADHGKIDMSQLPVGTYLVRVSAGNQFTTFKVLKQ